MVCRTHLLRLLPTHHPIGLGALQLLCISVQLEEVQDVALASVLHADSVADVGTDRLQCHAVWLLYRPVHRRRHDANHQGQYGD